MYRKLKCFISAAHGTNLLNIQKILADNDVECYDAFDFQGNESMQGKLIENMSKADFAIFVIAGDSQTMIYEMGVCDGLGKPYIIFLEKGYKIPFFIENKLFVRSSLRDIDFLEQSILKVLPDLRKEFQ